MLYELNRLILKHTPRHIAKEVAPETFESLNRHIGQLIVWDGASDNTIFQDNKVNYAFRAWHDSLHLKLNAEFNQLGEYRLAWEQARILNQHSELYADLVIIEIAGQFEYFKTHGIFPTQQALFAQQMLNNRAALTQLTETVRRSIF